MVEQPSGTVTLVFTDIEGSTRLLRELGEQAYREALAEHRRIVRETCGRYEGYEVDNEGDSFFYAFPSAGEAVAAVDETIRGLEPGPIRIRVGIHTGEPSLDPPKYLGLDVHLAARVMAAGHGGQVVLTAATRALVDAPVRDLGEHRLKDVVQPVRLYQLGGDEFPPLRSIGGSNLPHVTTTFVGRVRERKQALDLVRRDDVGLVTLTGPGGAGKTRLAVEVGGAVAREREVVFVDLSSARSEGEPLQALATVLSVRDPGAGSLLDGVSAALSVRVPLLILDNCEQVANAVARLVQALLGQTRGVWLLATSRVPLHVEGEYRLALAPLQIPAADDARPERTEAVQMFLDRVRMVAPAFAPDAGAVTAAGELVRELDGLPLAIELAAARAALLGVAVVGERLDQRFRILRTSGDGAEGRHSSLEATLDWSYQLCDPAGQTALRQLSVFAASFSLEAAEAIIGADAIELVPTLADASLLTIEDTGNGVYRYRLLETIRAFADELLVDAERDHAEADFAEWAVTTAEAAAALFDTPEERRGLATLDQEGDNCSAALSWALEREPRLGLRLALGLSGWRGRRGRYLENIEALTEALERNADADTDVRARLLLALAESAMRRGDLPGAEQLASEAAELFIKIGDEGRTVTALVRIATCQRNQAKLTEASGTAQKAYEYAKRHGDADGTANSLKEIGFVALYGGNYSQAYDKAQAALLVVPEADVSADARTEAQSLLAVAAWYLGRLDEAEAASRDGLARTSDAYFAHWLKVRLAAIREEQGDRLEPLELLREALEFAASSGEPILLGNALGELAGWALASGNHEQAALLHGASDRAFGGAITRVLMDDKTSWARAAPLIEQTLGSKVSEQAFARGAKLTADELLDLGRRLDGQLRNEGEHGPRPSELFANWRENILARVAKDE